jgi:MFS family permease
MGVVLMSLYPALTAASTNLPRFLLTASVGGLAWSLAGGALANYIYEKMPESERPFHLAWYHLSFNAAILLGALCGPLLAEHTGLAAALVLIAFGRYLAGAALWRWG